MGLTNDKPLRPDQVNDHSQVTDESVLKRERVKFGLGTVLYQSEETGLGGVPTAIIRSLGGDDRHIGIFGCVNGLTSLFQWIGTLLIRRCKSNRKAMIVSMALGLSVASLIAASILFSSFSWFSGYSLWCYLGFSLLLAVIGGVQWNIESSWIGDLVPKHRLGWFTSVKWFIGVAGIFVFMNLIGRVCDRWPSPQGYSSVYIMFAGSFFVATFLYKSVTDRTPKSALFFSKGASNSERLNYRSNALWCYIAFYVLWAGGRTMLFTFWGAYLIDAFKFSMTKVAWMLSVQYMVSCIMVLVMGRFTDRTGHRIPLIIVTAIVGASMGLWVASAWFGVITIVIFQILNGAAGHTHSMLAINFGLEIFPDKGRSGYLAFSRIFIGVIAILMPVLAGRIMFRLHDFHYALWGAILTKYHVLFILSTIVTLCASVPLVIIGNRRVDAASASESLA